FQAEDGIRDYKVTGVQTCALPILSYNNYGDADAAFELVGEFAEPAVAIVKHANPCGVAIGANLRAAWDKALACDPVSAYGGVVRSEERRVGKECRCRWWR